ncbi:hypothetical protein [Streptacidiphilus jiangxiensis]|uniref:Uncharacterized protein n=1 Tax=Streptacidiphilus jiangxiensis TaxID=235985 RepID=A0A1H7F1P0_STRJI|nr:hypothetical protein [Streptacidiphilus jiangxiensis]SEK20019.1 hypothetical protein SAMN05414137_10142 [Streptacidiphilus jiangxiensis]
MSNNKDPREAASLDGGTMHLRAQPEDAPQDAVPPAEAGTVRLGRAAVPAPAADPEVVPTVRLSAPPEPTATVRLGADPDVIPTVRLPAGTQAPVPTPTLHLPVEPEMSAAAPAAAPEASAEAAPDPGLIRFGPGVPDPKTARTIAVWKGEVAPEPEVQEEKKRNGWLFWVPVLLVFLGLLAWWLYGLLAPAQLKLTAASVQVAPAAVSCGGKATVTATVTTDGSGGSFHYRWLRSDGTDSGWLTETVAVGTRTVQLPLIWSLSGPGTFAGRATLEVQDHPALTRTGSFSYSCAG